MWLSVSNTLEHSLFSQVNTKQNKTKCTCSFEQPREVKTQIEQQADVDVVTHPIGNLFLASSHSFYARLFLFSIQVMWKTAGSFSECGSHRIQVF